MDNEEYKQDEFNITCSVAEKLCQDVKSGKPVSLQQLLPDHQIEKPTLLWTPVAPVPHFYAFCRQLLLPLAPLSEPAFSTLYGIDLPTVIKLVRNGQLIPIFESHTNDSIDMFPAGFRPLFESVHVPNILFRSLRMQMDAQAISIDTQTRECMEWVGKLTAKFFEDTDGIRGLLSEYLNVLREMIGVEAATASSQDVFEILASTTARSVLLSHALHREDYLRKINSVSDPVEAFVCMATLMESHDRLGITSDVVPIMDSSIIDGLREIHEDIYGRDRFVASTRYLLGQLTVKLGYSHPDNLSKEEVPDYVNKLHEGNDISEHFKIMTSFQRFMESGDFDRAISESVRFSEAWGAVQRRVREINKKGKLIKCAVYPAFAVLSPSLVAATATVLENTASQFYFPMVAGSAILGMAGLALEQVQSRLEELARNLTGRVCGRESVAFLVWEHGEPDKGTHGH